jgi:hypothetical protein
VLVGASRLTIDPANERGPALFEALVAGRLLPSTTSTPSAHLGSAPMDEAQQP